ncbi:hypothetical protein HFO32_22150 [Rhizobium leguminosarum]|uniref:hypothetical protein n=1 Tax=Rhizobiaceae TaxID=82115 RepID=UPI000FDBF979|nr:MULTISPECIES: hypothetical protein [Rhizobiaceae]MBY5684828.1 hypothetical protein [Rhizobium leguminosarum]RVL87673.1 hypothetical protein CN140_01710 [Sinorhizobium meliloti]
MIIVIHPNHRSEIFAIHDDSQEADVLAAYDINFGVFRTEAVVNDLSDPLPNDLVMIRDFGTYDFLASLPEA